MSKFLRIGGGILLLIIGWLLCPIVLQYLLSHFQDINVQFSSGNPTGQLLFRLYFSVHLGLIPIWLWIVSKTFYYKKRSFEVLAYPLMFGCAALFLKLRFQYLATFLEEFSLGDTMMNLNFSMLKINQYLFFGIVVGLLLYLGLGMLLKQLTLKYTHDRKKKLAEEDIGRIGRSDD